MFAMVDALYTVIPRFAPIPARNRKFQTRNPKQIPMTKNRNLKRRRRIRCKRFGPLAFGVLDLFGISDFVLALWLQLRRATRYLEAESFC